MLEPASPPSRRSLIVTRGAEDRFGVSAAMEGGGANPAEDLFALRSLAERVQGDPGGGEAGTFEGASAGRLLALRLVGRFLRNLIDQYRRERDGEVLTKALSWLLERHGETRVGRVLRHFRELFRTSLDPGPGASSALAPGDSEEVLLEDLLVLWAINENPAAGPWRPLFDDAPLEEETGYRELVEDLREFFGRQPGFGPDDGNFFDLLRAPARAAPDSPGEQLGFLLRLAEDSTEGLEGGLLLGIDVLKEEERPVFPGPGGGPPGPGPALVLDYEEEEDADERFSEDRHWMPELVLLAKNAFVWLHQLSRRYGRPIRRLDEIPERELDRIAGDGITGLWLIGIWERSRASERIKQLCGNPEAAASAYSLDEYRIASELGGEEALDQLRRRAWQRRLRLACDMVPNHMGIDSRWVVERPELFLSVPRCPYPNYSFNGPDLSSDPRVGIFLEDHYFDRSDAAVVFKRVDRRSGEECFIYHGNDGTGMPWNDTAQLDYLNPATREAVLETILDVARQFPVIRFDAAMTLARRHIRRLWYPPPGEGGDVPSRSAYAVSQEDFDQRLPTEFWRDVVDRLAEEAPDTLLLAEAFWLMEGYFVRTLGMHRVYNSAFMNMLRDEENGKFRDSLKNTLAFRPEILRRFVNYVTTPDEEPAAQQLGTGDKYFGICTLMATLPGLPLVGHGQFEGLAEKYGMEYRRALAEEAPDPHLMARHERQIAPLLAERHLFAGVESFELYDLDTADGVDEDVIAFSNGLPSQRVLVILNNRYGAARGHLQRAVPKLPPEAEEGSEGTVRRPLARALGLRCRGDDFCRFRDRLSGLEFLVPSRAILEEGLPVHLEAYECRVLSGFQEIQETADLRLERLARSLAGGGVASLQEALEDLFAEGQQEWLTGLLKPSLLRPLAAALGASPEGLPVEPPALDALEEQWRDALRQLSSSLGEDGFGLPAARRPVAEATAGTGFEEVAAGARRSVAGLLEIFGGALPQDFGDLLETIRWQAPAAPPADPAEPPREDLAPGARPAASVIWALLRTLGAVARQAPSVHRSLDLFDGLRLGRRVEIVLRELGVETAGQVPAAASIRLFVGLDVWYRDLPAATTQELLEGWLKDGEVRRFLGIHAFGGVLWFRREAFRTFLWWLLTTAAADLAAAEPAAPDPLLGICRERVEDLLAAEAASDYRVDLLLEALGGEMFEELQRLLE